MRTLKLTPRKLFFVVATRAALGTGIGLLLSQKLSGTVRKRLGVALAALGGLTTIPAVTMLRASAR